MTALVMSSSRLAASGLSRRIGTHVLAAIASASAETALLMAHHVGGLNQPLDLTPLSAESLGQMGRFGVAAWPATRALTVRTLNTPTTELVHLLGTQGTAAVVDVGSGADTVPVELMRSIVAEPQRHPLPWLLAAERRISQTANEPHLAAVADSERWFGE